MLPFWLLWLRSIRFCLWTRSIYKTFSLLSSWRCEWRQHLDPHKKENVSLILMIHYATLYNYIFCLLYFIFSNIERFLIKHSWSHKLYHIYIPQAIAILIHIMLISFSLPDHGVVGPQGQPQDVTPMKMVP